jgi:hypothetical protein
MAKTRIDLLEAELERLKQEGAQLERDWRRIPLLTTTVVFVAPVYFVWGPTAAFYGVLCVPSLVLTAIYLVMVRRNENRDLIGDVRRQIERTRATTPHADDDEE